METPSAPPLRLLNNDHNNNNDNPHQSDNNKDVEGTTTVVS